MRASGYRGASHTPDHSSMTPSLFKRPTGPFEARPIARDSIGASEFTVLRLVADSPRYVERRGISPSLIQPRCDPTAALVGKDLSLATAEETLDL